MRRRSLPTERSGFALVLVVVMVALLGIMAVAYLSTSSLERATARASANKTKADLAARAAADIAIQQLRDNFRQYPDSATTWETINVWPATALYYREQTPEAVGPTPAPIKVLPLISGAVAKNLADKSSTLPATADDTNSFNLNHKRSTADAVGWIGAPQGAAVPPEVRAQWLQLTNSDGQVTSRYAFWVEDESFKANANLMGKTPRGSNTLGDSPVQIPLQGLIQVAQPDGDADALANSIFSFRDQFTNKLLLEFRELNTASTQNSFAEQAKFYSTIFSGALNTSRSGSKRANLNKLVSASNDPGDIRKQLDQIIRTLKHHSPNFSQRFYRSSVGSNLNNLDVPETGTPPHQTVYLNKLAANIRDYVDADSQPTIVNNDATYTIRIGSAPEHPVAAIGGGTAGTNEVIAIGKERVPFMQEYAIRIRQIEFGPRLGVSATYKISIDHYVEFWNTSNRDINASDLGPNPFLLIANQPGWDAGTFPGIPEGQTRDLKIPLPSGLVFPAGAATVITTDPELLPTLTPNAARVVQVSIPENKRTYAGQTDRKSSGNLRLNMKDRTSSTTDYETEILLGNDLGIIESAWGGGAIASAISINIDDGNARFDTSKYHFRGATLRASGSTNAEPFATSGDPRSNAEQIRMDLNGSSAANDKTRYYSSGLQDNAVPGNATSRSTLGAPNQYTAPGTWADPAQPASTAPGAPSVVLNANLASIGQLGDVYDPARAQGDSNNILFSRGGGRTLRVGQSDRFDSTVNRAGVWDGAADSKSREWTAWRLADIFSTSDSIQLDGRINVNGVRRDNGGALKAALFGYAFQTAPDSDPNLAGQALDQSVVDVIVQQLVDRLNSTTDGPLWERGEVSELPIFNPGTGLAASASAPVLDRGREEVFRRIAELITTRGNVFTVYAVGQALAPRPATATAAPRVLSTSQLKITFRLDPVWGTPPSDPFDPTTAATRFKKPDRYDIKILYAGE